MLTFCRVLLAFGESFSPIMRGTNRNIKMSMRVWGVRVKWTGRYLVNDFGRYFLKHIHSTTWPELVLWNVWFFKFYSVITRHGFKLWTHMYNDWAQRELPAHRWPARSHWSSYELGVSSIKTRWARAKLCLWSHVEPLASWGALNSVVRKSVCIPLGDAWTLRKGVEIYT